MNRKEKIITMEEVVSNFEYGEIYARVLEIEESFEIILKELKKIEEKNIEVDYDLKQNIENNYSGINDSRKIICSLLFQAIVIGNTKNNNEKGTLIFGDIKVQN